jgi:SPP1 family predicted phage head-tail adaptor
MALAAGKLKHFVELQRPKTTQNATTGEMVTSWVKVANFYAEIVPQSVSDFIAAAANQSEVRGRMTIRRRSDIDATMRVVHRGLAYQIVGVLPDMESGLEYQSLPVSEGVRVN